MKLLLPPPLVLLVAGALMWAVAGLLPATGFQFPFQFRVAFFFVAVAIAIDVAAIGLFRRSETTVSPLKPENASVLVTSGVYRFSRNPMYLGMVLILTGFWRMAWQFRVIFHHSPVCMVHDKISDFAGGRAIASGFRRRLCGLQRCSKALDLASVTLNKPKNLAVYGCLC